MKGTKKLKRILTAMTAAVAMTTMCSAVAMAAEESARRENFWGEGDIEYGSPEFIIDEGHSYSTSKTGSDSSDPRLWIIEERTSHEYVKGSGASVTITCNGEFSKFSSVYVDGEYLEKTNYTAVEGSTVLTLMPEYLETLPVGVHTVTLNYTYGSVDSLLNVVERSANGGGASNQPAQSGSAGNSSAPRTGDTSGLVLWSMAAMASGCVILIRRKRTDVR